MAYVSFIIYASLYETSIAEKSEQEYQKFLLTTKGRLYSAFSVPKNWKRLSGKKSAQTEQLRAFQGVRFHNLLIVILVHTVVATLMAPIANTKYTETVRKLKLYPSQRWHYRGYQERYNDLQIFSHISRFDDLKHIANIKSFLKIYLIFQKFLAVDTIQHFHYPVLLVD